MEMLQHDFMQRAFFAGGVIAIIASILGVFLLLRRQALMSDMLSHVSLAGVAAGGLLHLNPTISGFVVAVAGAVAAEYVRQSYKTYSELSIAIIMVGGLSTAVVLMSMQPAMNRSITSYLFGSVIAVSTTDLLLVCGVALVSLLFFVLLYRPLYHMTFDEETARTSGVPVKWISPMFSVLTGMIVAAAMPIVGVLLVSALVVLPAALAVRLASSFLLALAVAVLVGVSGVFGGLTLSYEWSTPPGATIALTLLLFLIAGTAIRKIVFKFRRNPDKQI